jgi:hypothetical protein
MLALALVIYAPCAPAQTGAKVVEDFMLMDGFHRSYAAMYLREDSRAVPSDPVNGFGLEIRQMLKRVTLTLRGTMMPTPDDRTELNSSLGLEWWPLTFRTLSLGAQGHVGLTNVNPEPETLVGTEVGYGATLMGRLSDHIAVSSSLNFVNYEEWGRRRQLIVRVIVF